MFNVSAARSISSKFNRPDDLRALANAYIIACALASFSGILVSNFNLEKIAFLFAENV